MMYLDRVKLQARHLSPLDVMKAVDDYNVFLPAGSAKFGTTDYAIDSNSMFDQVGLMEDIPLRNEHGNAAFLRDVATPKDANFIQTNVVRVNGKRQVYVPVFRQLGASTLQVVDTLKESIETIKARLTRPGIDLKVVMDQSVYVRHSIESLVEEGVLGAVLCSLVILVFLGEWRMTVIAVLTIPIAVLASLIGLYATGNTINVMTLAGLSLAIGPMVERAIICLENTHRHLGLGASPEEAAFKGASEVAMPELVASLCTLLVLTAGADAWLGRVSLPPDGRRGGVRHDLRLRPLPLVCSLPLGHVVEAHAILPDHDHDHALADESAETSRHEEFQIALPPQRSTPAPAAECWHVRLLAGKARSRPGEGGTSAS